MTAAPATSDHPSDLRDLAERLARAAGAVLADRPAELVADAKSTPTDAVTQMDRAAERLVLDGLAASRPDDRVVAEESGSSGPPDPDRLTWLVDPLDGTVNYLYGIPVFAVSIAVAAGDQLLAGVVYDVSRDELWSAVSGRGAFCNGRPVQCRTETDPAMALLSTGFAYSAHRRAWQATVLAGVLPRVRDIRRMGSAALDQCAVAGGRVDGYFEAGMAPWDWAAGALVAREAGARVEGLQGRPPGHRLTVAANPALFDALHDLLVAAGGADEPAGEAPASS
jgi:myo-inositol-1(or 4)-monophosphatase